MKIGFWTAVIIFGIIYFSVAGTLMFYGTSCENRTITGKIVSLEQLPVKDRFLISFSDGSTFVIDNYALASFDGYEGRMQVKLLRRIYHDSDYWSVESIIKLDSWVKP